MRVKPRDSDLKNHIKKGISNALYTSPAIQNDIILICYNLILGKIVIRIKKMISIREIK